MSTPIERLRASNFASPAGHEPSSERYKSPRCWACDCSWPCPTVMLATIDALQAENARLRTLVDEYRDECVRQAFENARLREQAEALLSTLQLIADGECGFAYGHEGLDCAKVQAAAVLRAYREEMEHG